MLGPGDTARVLGVSYSNYAAMKNGSRPIPPYVVNHVETIMLLPAGPLTKMLRRRLNGSA